MRSSKTFSVEYIERNFKDNGGSNVAQITTASDHLNLVTVSSRDIKFKPAGSERMVIESDGNVGIGTTDPATKLSVSGGDIAAYNSNGTSRVIVSEDGSTTFNSLIMESAGASNNTHFYTDGTSNAMSISSKGATSDIVLSARQDISFKTNCNENRNLQKYVYAV